MRKVTFLHAIGIVQEKTGVEKPGLGVAPTQAVAQSATQRRSHRLIDVLMRGGLGTPAPAPQITLGLCRRSFSAL